MHPVHSRNRYYNFETKFQHAWIRTQQMKMNLIVKIANIFCILKMIIFVELSEYRCNEITRLHVNIKLRTSSQESGTNTFKTYLNAVNERYMYVQKYKIYKGKG